LFLENCVKRKEEGKMKAVILSVILSLGMSCTAWAQMTTATCDEQPKIKVSGDAVVNVKPDRIVVVFGVETYEKTIMEAKNKSSGIMKKAIAVAKECGVPAKDIQTDTLSIEPIYKPLYKEDEDARKKIVEYVVRNTFAVTLSEPAKVEELVTRELEAGVNYLHDIDFQTSALKGYREQARELALKAAKEKAQKMAAALGQTVGQAIEVHEDYSGSPWSYYSGWRGWGSNRQQAMSQNITQNIRGTSPEISDSIALGKLSIRSSVSVVFELRK
jgi:uncharacterized protein YggE